MDIYYFLYTLIVLTASYKRRQNAHNIEPNPMLTNFLVGIVILIMALRHQSMGADLGYYSPYGYLAYFQKLSQLSWGEILSMKSYMNYERGYIIFNKLISIVTNDPQWLLICCAIISLVPIGCMIKKFSLNPEFSLIVYLGLPCFLIVYSGLRQAIAIGICCLAYEKVIQKKPWKFAMYVVIACSFHYSAILFLLVYPIFHIKVTKKSRLITAAFPFFVYAFRHPLFAVLSKILKEHAVARENGAITLFLVFVGIYLYCSIFISDEDEIANGFLNIFLIACCCQAFGGIFMIAIRVGYYFMVALVIALPNIVMKIRNKNSFFVSYYVVQIVFVAYGLYAIYNSSWPMAYPYYFFWSQI